MPAAPGPPWSAVEYTSTHPHDVRLRRAQSGGNEVGVRCKTKPRPWGQITTGAVRLLRTGRGCLARRAIVARIGLVIGKQKAPHRYLHANSCSWLNSVESFFARLSRRAPLETRRLPLHRRPPSRHQPLPRRDQRRTEALHMDRRPRQNHRRTDEGSKC